MVEYAVVVGDLRDALNEIWTGKFLPLIDTIRSSPYFWPGAVALLVLFLLAARKIVK